MEIQAGQLVTDGTVKWIMVDTRDGTPVSRVVGDICLRDGYVKANGATVQRADYPRLVHFADKYNLWTAEANEATYPGMFGSGNGTTTMSMPDWRGVVARFVDDGKGYDAGRVLGTYQEDMFESHIHEVERKSGQNVSIPAAVYPSYRSGDVGNVNLNTYAAGGAETRMKNIALIAQIKY